MRKNYHYVYRITEIITNMHYYGDRSCDCPPVDDLGTIYFSSFTNYLFRIDQKENPKRYKYKVIKVFKSDDGFTRKNAKELEIVLHNKFNVAVNVNFINRAKQTSIGFDRTGLNHTEESKIKISRSGKGKGMSGKIVSKERRQQISKSLLGHKQSLETRYKKSESHKGLYLSQETKDKIGNANRNKPKPKITCRNCGKMGDVGNMKRWHFNKCKGDI